MEEKVKTEDNIKIEKIASEDKSVLQNLFQLYMHDITAWLPMDVNKHGLFEYDYIDSYFNDNENRFAYFVYINSQIAGFVLINNDFMVLKQDKNNYNLSEMFVLNAYKHKGFGEYIANKIFDMFKGNWEVRPIPRSEGAKKFWLKAIKNYTNNNFAENYPKPNRLSITFTNL